MLTHRAGYYPWLFSVVAYGAAGDGQMAVDGAVSTGTPTTLTCATSAPFKARDLGKAGHVHRGLGPGSAGPGRQFPVPQLQRGAGFVAGDARDSRHRAL